MWSRFFVRVYLAYIYLEEAAFRRVSLLFSRRNKIILLLAPLPVLENKTGVGNHRADLVIAFSFSWFSKCVSLYCVRHLLVVVPFLPDFDLKNQSKFSKQHFMQTERGERPTFYKISSKRRTFR